MNDVEEERYKNKDHFKAFCATRKPNNDSTILTALPLATFSCIVVLCMLKRQPLEVF